MAHEDRPLADRLRDDRRDRLATYAVLSAMLGWLSLMSLMMCHGPFLIGPFAILTGWHGMRQSGGVGFRRDGFVIARGGMLAGALSIMLAVAVVFLDALWVIVWSGSP